LKYDRGEDTVRAEPGRLAVGTQLWVKMQVVWVPMVSRRLNQVADSCVQAWPASRINST